MTTPTIYALATPPGRGAVAIIRVSGPAAFASLSALTGQDPPAPRMASVRTLRDGTGVMLDEALVLAFKAPHSFTGEDVVEYQLHGGRAVTNAVLQALAQQKNHALAAPGEFTRRAFEHGKLDLTEAEAIADLVDAETALQQAQALDQLGGVLKQLYEDWRARLIGTLAYLEADLDFPDEDLPGGLPQRMRPELEKLVADIAVHLNDARRGERLRDGFSVVILGPPNAGKSSLMNALAKRDVAIVSAQAGTTRDVLEVHLDIGGYPVVLVDTAGLRGTTDDPIEAEGMARARARAEAADLKLWLVAPDIYPQADSEFAAAKNYNTLIVHTKSDVRSVPGALNISTSTGAGLDELLQALLHKIEALYGRKTAPTLTRARHREALIAAHDHLLRALAAPLPELATEDARLATRAIGSITGRVDVEELLDRIFRDFCIGK